MSSKKKKATRHICTTGILLGEDLLSGERALIRGGLEEVLENPKLLALVVDKSNCVIAYFADPANPEAVVANLSDWIYRMHIVYGDNVPNRHALRQVMDHTIENLKAPLTRFTSLMPRPKDELIYLNPNNFPEAKIVLDLEASAEPTFIVSATHKDSVSKTFTRRYSGDDLLELHEQILQFRETGIQIPVQVS